MQAALTAGAAGASLWAMRYVGPIYRPPSEADSLLIQASEGCPHNKCSFCLVYKRGPRFRARPPEEIEADLLEAAQTLGKAVRTIFLPAGDSMALPGADLVRVCRKARELFPRLERITTYASMASIEAHGPEGLAELAAAGLTRLHAGLESGSAEVLRRVKKGTDPDQQVRAGRMALAAGLELNLYVMLGLGGPELSRRHAAGTARVLNRICQAGEISLRLRTLVPKTGTLLLHQLKKGRFTLMTCHQVLDEASRLIAALEGPLEMFSDHYTNYVNLRGRLPDERPRLLAELETAARLPRDAFRPDFVGDQ